MNVVRQPEYFDAGPGGEGQAFAWLPTLMSFLNRRWRTIVAWTVIVLILGVGYVIIATPKYTAEVSLLIDTKQGNAFQQNQPATNGDPALDNSIVESQVEVLRSLGLARTVVQALHLDTDKQFAGWAFSLPRFVLGTVIGLIEPPSTRAPQPGDGVDRAADELAQLTTVRRIGLSNVITVEVITPDPVRSAQIANAISTAYVHTSLDAKYDVTRQAGTWLQDRLKELRDQSIAADDALQQMRAKVGIVDTDKGGLNEQQLGDLSLQLATARANLSTAESRYARIQAITAAGVTSASSGSVSDALANTVIQKLQAQYLDDARKLADWTVRYGANHIAVVQLRTEMAGLQQSIGGELGRIQEAYKSDLDVARSNEGAIQKQIDGLIAVSTATNNARVQVRALQSLSDTYHNLYSSFLQRYTQAAQDQSFPISQSRVITDATPPLRKSRPVTLLVLLGSIVVGGAVGVGVATFKELTDRRVLTAAQLRAVTGLDVLGLLPALDRTDVPRPRGRGERTADGAGRTLPLRPAILRWVVDQPFSPFSEVLRGLRVRIGTQRARARPMHVIAVVSAATGEGKTVVAANLAQALAGSGHRTVLVDADLRKPQLTHWWSSERTAGFSEVQGGSVLAADALFHDAQTGLAFLPASTAATGHASDVLGSSRMRDMVANLRESFEYVVLDLSSLATAADAHALAPLVDGFIVVVEWAETHENTLVDGLMAADIEAGKLLGAVINKVDMKAMRRLTQGSGQSYRAFASEIASS